MMTLIAIGIVEGILLGIIILGFGEMQLRRLHARLVDGFCKAMEQKRAQFEIDGCWDCIYKQEFEEAPAKVMAAIKEQQGGECNV